jgi:Spy/CpxP family protein refolding chaperone
MNTSRNTIKFVVAAVLGGLLSLSVMAFPGHHDGRLAKALDLTDAQITQLKSMRKNHKANRKQTKDAMKALNEKTQALMSNYSDAQAQVIAEESAAMHKARVLTKLQHQQALYAMLDDDQKKKFLEIMAKHPKKNRKHKHSDRMDDDQGEDNQDD